MGLKICSKSGIRTASQLAVHPIRFTIVRDKTKQLMFPTLLPMDVIESLLAFFQQEQTLFNDLRQGPCKGGK